MALDIFAAATMVSAHEHQSDHDYAVSSYGCDVWFMYQCLVLLAANIWNPMGQFQWLMPARVKGLGLKV